MYAFVQSVYLDLETRLSIVLCLEKKYIWKTSPRGKFLEIWTVKEKFLDQEGIYQLAKALSSRAYRS